MEQRIAELARETRSSIEVTKDAKGDYQWCIKYYFEHNCESLACQLIASIDIKLREIFDVGVGE